MSTTSRWCAVLSAATLLVMTSVHSAFAGTQDYEFRLLQRPVQMSEAAVLEVQLIDKRTGEAVSDAVIFRQRVDMAPDGMESMTGSITQLPSSEPGSYRFEAGLIMEGNWRLSLAAKVQGEEGTLVNRMDFEVLP